jgi:hypothetical protein
MFRFWTRGSKGCKKPQRARSRPRKSFRPQLEALEERYAPATTLAISDPFIALSGVGTVNMNFAVTRTGDLTSTVVAGYQTVDGTAHAGIDYTGTTNGVLTFPPGAATETISVPILSTTALTETLTFSVQLTGIQNVIGPPVTFAGQTTFAAGTQPFSVAVADINGDGKPDLIVANYLDGTVSVLLNKTAPGAAMASFATQQTFATGGFPHSVAVTDVNGDGEPDVIVADGGGTNTVSVLVNRTAPGAATASFATQRSFTAGVGPFSVAVADINGDGKPDLIVANDDNTVSVLVNTTAPGAATASFATQQAFAAGGILISVAVADVNGDGKPDLITANDDIPGTVSVLLNTTVPGAATASFATQQTFATGGGPMSVSVADANADGKPDLIVANWTDSTVSVLLNTTTPGAATASFATQQTFATGINPFSVAVSDVNGDGKPDLIVANTNNRTVSVLENTTAPGAVTAAFATQQSLVTGEFPRSVAVADVNGDGKPDLITANDGDATVSVLLNTTVIGAATIVPAFPQTTLPRPPSNILGVAAGDLNGDGKPDLIWAGFGGNVEVQLNTTAPGAAVPTFTTLQTFTILGDHLSVAVADMNGDGRADVVVPGFATGTVAVLLNTTTPGSLTASFATPQTFATGNDPAFVAAVDVNGDGKPDLIVGSQDDTVSVLLNTTTPGSATASFATPRTFATGSDLMSLAVADVNGDGKPDLITANADDATVSVLLNTTAPGSLTASFATQQTFATGTAPFSVAVSDVNGDGKRDLIVADRGDDTVSVLLNSTAPGAATASFATQQTFAVENGPQTVAVADVNGDGKPDLIVANGYATTTSVLLNTTPPGSLTASFASPETFATGPTVFSMAVADLNGDGRPDFTTANAVGPDDSVLLNTPVVITTATATGTIVGGTMTTVFAAPSDPTYGTLTTFTAVVARDFGSSIPNGTVSFTIDGNLWDSGEPVDSNGFATSVISSLPVGPHQITASYTPAAISGFTGSTSAPLSISVVPATLTVTAHDQTMMYGGTVPPLTYTVTGFQNGEELSPSTVSGTPILSTGAGPTSPIGNYDITVSAGSLSAANYTFHLVSGTLTITPAPLTVTADNQTMVYGGTLPPLTYTITGFQNGQDLSTSGVSGTPSLATVDPTSSVGSYDITPMVGSLIALNYRFQFVPGTLTITPAPLIIKPNPQSMTYGATMPPLTAFYFGFVNGDTPPSLTTAPTLTTAPANSPVGSYDITASGAVDPNYVITYFPGRLTITPATLTAKADNQTMTYGGPLPVLTGTLTGVVNGDPITAGNSTTATPTTDVVVGGYPITATLSDPSNRLGNYTVVNHPGTLTVVKANQTIHWSNPANIIYGTALTGTQLNATVSVVGPAPAGALTYLPAAGTILGPGSGQILTVTVAATNDYNAATFSVPINVLYHFGGFEAPLRAGGAYRVNQALRIDFQLTDASGHAITDLSAMTSLQIQPVDASGNPQGAAFNPASSGNTGLRNNNGHFNLNWDTRGLSPGYYDIVLTLSDGTTEVLTIQLTSH